MFRFFFLETRLLHLKRIDATGIVIEEQFVLL